MSKKTTEEDQSMETTSVETTTDETIIWKKIPFNNFIPGNVPTIVPFKKSTDSEKESDSISTTVNRVLYSIYIKENNSTEQFELTQSTEDPDSYPIFFSQLCSVGKKNIFDSITIVFRFNPDSHYSKDEGHLDLQWADFINSLADAKHKKSLSSDELSVMDAYKQLNHADAKIIYEHIREFVKKDLENKNKK